MLIGSLLLLLRTIGSRLKVWHHLLVLLLVDGSVTV